MTTERQDMEDYVASEMKEGGLKKAEVEPFGEAYVVLDATDNHVLENRLFEDPEEAIELKEEYDAQCPSLSENEYVIMKVCDGCLQYGAFPYDKTMYFIYDMPEDDEVVEPDNGTVENGKKETETETEAEKRPIYDEEDVKALEHVTMLIDEYMCCEDGNLTGSAKDLKRLVGYFYTIWTKTVKDFEKKSGPKGPMETARLLDEVHEATKGSTIAFG